MLPKVQLTEAHRMLEPERTRVYLVQPPHFSNEKTVPEKMNDLITKPES